MIRRFDSLKESDNKRKLMRRNIRSSSLREAEDEDIYLEADAVDSDEETVTVELTQSEVDLLQKILSQVDETEEDEEDEEDSEDEELEEDSEDEELEESEKGFRENRLREARSRVLAKRRQQRLREARNRILANREVRNRVLTNREDNKTNVSLNRERQVLTRR